VGDDREAITARVGEARRRSETARLLMRARASSGAARTRYENEVVSINLPVARDIARSYRGRGIADDDLDQVASLGLVKAVRAFDPTLGDDFLSFAVPTLRGELRRHFRDAGWTVRPPRSVQETQAAVVSAEAELSQRLGRQPDVAEIAAHLGLSVPLVRDALSADGCYAPVSLDAPRPTTEESPVARLGDVDPAFASTEARLAVLPLLVGLGERERTIVGMRFFDNRTQSEIGDAVGVSQEQVSRLLAGILARLREALEEPVEAGATRQVG